MSACRATLEPTHQPDAAVWMVSGDDPLKCVAGLLARRIPVVLATVVDTQGSAPGRTGWKVAVSVDTQAGTVGGGAIEHAIVERCQRMLHDGSGPTLEHYHTRDLGMCCGGSMTVFFEPFAPPPRLVIFGAGHVAKAVCAIASLAGFDVTVCDGREEWLTEARFHQAKERILLDADIAVSRTGIDPSSFVLVMTHDHALDEEVLMRISKLESHPRWIGVVGSRRKRARFSQRLSLRGLPPGDIDAIHMPVGLDLGGSSPHEIAVAITADLIATRHRGKARPT